MSKSKIGLFALICVVVGGFFIATHVFKSTEDTMIEDLKVRYSEDVEFIEFDQEASNEQTKVAKMKSADGEFTCVKYFDLEGKAHYKDNYLGKKYEKEIQSLVSSLMPEDCEASVNIGESVFGEIDNPTKMSLEELLAMPTTYIKVDVTSQSSWDDEKVKTLAEKLKGKVKVNCSIYWDNMCYYFSVNPSGEVVDTNLQEVK